MNPYKPDHTPEGAESPTAMDLSRLEYLDSRDSTSHTGFTEKDLVSGKDIEIDPGGPVRNHYTLTFNAHTVSDRDNKTVMDVLAYYKYQFVKANANVNESGFAESEKDDNVTDLSGSAETGIDLHPAAEEGNQPLRLEILEHPRHDLPRRAEVAGDRSACPPSRKRFFQLQ